MADSEAKKVLFSKDGVFIHTTVVQEHEDALVPGKIFLLEKKEGVFIEWKALEPSGSEAGSEWAVVDTVSYNKQTSKSGAVSVNMKKLDSIPHHHRYKINFDIKDLKSFKRSKPSLGWSYLIFILKCGTTCPALHFHRGGTSAFIRQLDNHLSVKKSPTDSTLYLVREHDPEAMSKSFDQLQLFEEQKPDIITNIINDPYSATLGGFSKVTNLLRAGLQLGGLTDSRPADEMAEAPDFTAEMAGMTLDNQEDSGFAVITKTSLPSRPTISRSSPVSLAQWREHCDPNVNQGRVTDVQTLKQMIFRGGIEAGLRSEVWKFLLGYYDWNSTAKEREAHRQNKVEEYFRMKLQWKSVSEEQEKRFFLHRDRKNLIEKDVARTDRTHEFFCGEENPNLVFLHDILMTYCMYNFDLGYVQGMSDLLAPILVIMENEVDAFWCFAHFMEQVWRNFELNQEGMKEQLNNLYLLINFADPTLCNYLESHDSSNMYFCFRWLLIMFKREFSFPDIMRLWEVMWTGLPCKNFHLLLCLAILDSVKSVLIENNFGFTEILKHINDMSLAIDLEETLRTAESIYLQLEEAPITPPQILNILKDTPGGATSQEDDVGHDDEESGGEGVDIPRSNSNTDEQYDTPSSSVNDSPSHGVNRQDSMTDQLSSALMEMNDQFTD